MSWVLGRIRCALFGHQIGTWWALGMTGVMGRCDRCGAVRRQIV